jgi:hypothetical protein
MSNLTNPTGRNLYKICKVLQVRPCELKNMDSFELDWWLENIQQDETEEFEKIKDIFEAIKPWLNYSLYKSEQETKKKVVTKSSTFMDDLMKHGASVTEAKNITPKDTVNIDALEQEIEREINGR